MPSSLLAHVRAVVALLLLHTRPAGAEESRPFVSVLAVRGSSPAAGNHPGYFASFGGISFPREDLALRVPEDRYGCEPTSGEAAAASGFVSVVLRGNCTFFEKAQLAQQSGAKGLIVVSDSQTVQIMGGPNGTEAEGVNIFVLGVDRKFGEQLSNASLAANSKGEGPVMMAATIYETSLLNFSEGVLICLATALVALGAHFSTADMTDVHPKGSLQTALAAPEEEVLEIDHWAAASFFVLGSCALVFLFFFMQYLIYVVMFSFCIGGASCMAQFGAVLLGHLFPGLKNQTGTLPVVGPLTHADVLAGIPALSIVVSWVVLRNTPYGWPFQDIIGSCFLMSLQRTIRLPNIKIATLLLSAMFFFDIFWVFISPVFFHQSVMVSVATGGGTGESVPMLLRIPAVGDAFGNDRLLGFGDIALPGLLISYLRRHDLQSRRSLKAGYFVPALAGYFVGLNLTIAALCIMRMGQPALLYLVPCTLGTTLILAKVRGESNLLWEGIPVKSEASHAISGDGV